MSWDCHQGHVHGPLWEIFISWGISLIILSRILQRNMGISCFYVWAPCPPLWCLLLLWRKSFLKLTICSSSTSFYWEILSLRSQRCVICPVWRVLEANEKAVHNRVIHCEKNRVFQIREGGRGFQHGALYLGGERTRHTLRGPEEYCLIAHAKYHLQLPLLIPHESMEACNVKGYSIPPQTMLFVNVWAMGRDESVWEDPLQFKPERFMGKNMDAKGHYFELLPFGTGRRGCPGISVGLSVVELALAKLIHCFDWSVACEVNMDEVFGLTVPMKFPLSARPSRRVTI